MTKPNGHLLTFTEALATLRPGEPDDPRPLLTLADGTTVRADEMWEWAFGRNVPVPDIARVGSRYWRNDPECGGWAPGGASWADPSPCWRRVYPPPDRPTREDDDTRTATIREELARLPLTPQVAALRPGDEFEVEHRGRRTWARVTDSWRVARGRFVRGRTTFGLIVTTHEEHISEVRREENEAIRESWARRFG